MIPSPKRKVSIQFSKQKCGTRYPTIGSITNGAIILAKRRLVKRFLFSYVDSQRAARTAESRGASAKSSKCSHVKKCNAILLIYPNAKFLSAEAIFVPLIIRKLYVFITILFVFFFIIYIVSGFAGNAPTNWTKWVKGRNNKTTQPLKTIIRGISC